MNILKNRFVKNTGWILAGKIVQMILSLAVNMLVARYLGPTNHGIINYVYSFVLFFTTFCTLGLNHVIIKELVESPDNEGEILGSALFMRLFSSIISMGLLVVIIYIFNQNDTTILLIAFLQSFTLLFSALDVTVYWYQAKLKSKTSTIVQTIAYIIMSIYKVSLVFFKKSLPWFAFSIALDYMIVAFMLLIIYYHDKGKKLVFSKPVAKKMIYQSYPFIIAGLMISIYGQIDKIMLRHMLDFSAVGLYSAAITITGLWFFIPSAIIDSARPIILEAKLNSQNLYEKRLTQLYASLIYLSLAFGIIITVLGKYIVYFLYGKDFLGATDALVISIWYCAFSLMGSANNIYLLTEGKTRFAQWICVIGALINILLNALMIPLWGIKGAAIATLLTQIITNLCVPLLFKSLRPMVKCIIKAFFLKGVFKEKAKQLNKFD